MLKEKAFFWSMSYQLISLGFYFQMGTLLTVFMFFCSFLPHWVTYITRKMSLNKKIKNASKGAKTIRHIKEAFLGYFSDFPASFGRVDFYIFFGVTFGSCAPLVSVFSFLGLLLFYFRERHFFLSTSRVPFFHSPSTVYTSLRVMYFSILLRILLSSLILSDPLLFPVQSTKTLIPPLSFLKPQQGSFIGEVFLRYNRIVIYLLLLVLWILFLLVSCIVSSICDLKAKRNWTKNEEKKCERLSEEDEGKNNYFTMENKIKSYTLYSYSIFSNPEWALLKAHFSADIPDEEGKEIIVNIKKDGTNGAIIADPNQKSLNPGEAKPNQDPENNREDDQLTQNGKGSKKNAVAPANKQKKLGVIKKTDLANPPSERQPLNGRPQNQNLNQYNHNNNQPINNRPQGNFNNHQGRPASPGNIPNGQPGGKRPLRQPFNKPPPNQNKGPRGAGPGPSKYFPNQPGFIVPSSNINPVLNPPKQRPVEVVSKDPRTGMTRQKYLQPQKGPNSIPQVYHPNLLSQNERKALFGVQKPGAEAKRPDQLFGNPFGPAGPKKNPAGNHPGQQGPGGAGQQQPYETIYNYQIEDNLAKLIERY